MIKFQCACSNTNNLQIVLGYKYIIRKDIQVFRMQSARKICLHMA